MNRRPLVIMAWLQGIYFFVTGVWPILHIASFVAVTGPKVDLWLVKTVGALIAVVGATLMLAARRRAVSAEVVFLAVASAASLGAADVIYALADRIWDIYLLDAAAEAGLIVLWLIAWRRR
jgi:hypothetical protein